MKEEEKKKDISKQKADEMAKYCEEMTKKNKIKSFFHKIDKK
jgi:hypothetical protein